LIFGGISKGWRLGGGTGEEELANCRIEYIQGGKGGGGGFGNARGMRVNG